jgi:hypothetical protein
MSWLDEKIARVRASMSAWTVRTACTKTWEVGAGWREIDREVMTDYQKKRSGRDPQGLDVKTSIAAH